MPRPLARQSGVGGKRLRRTLGIKIKRTPEEVREQTRRRVQRFRERTRVVVIIAVLALALLHDPAQAQPLDATVMTAQALPYPNPRDQNCASGYTSSGSYCRPIDDRSAPAIANPVPG